MKHIIIASFVSFFLIRVNCKSISTANVDKLIESNTRATPWGFLEQDVTVESQEEATPWEPEIKSSKKLRFPETQATPWEPEIKSSKKLSFPETQATPWEPEIKSSKKLHFPETQ